MHGHGRELLALGRYDEAEERLLEALARARRIEGPDHPSTLRTERSFATLRLAKGRNEEALAILESNVAATRRAEENAHALGTALALLGQALNALERYVEAEAAFGEALPLIEQALPEPHPDLAEARSHRGTALAGLGRFEDAESLLINAYRSLSTIEDLDPERTARAAGRVADFYGRRRDDAEASAWRERAHPNTR